MTEETIDEIPLIDIASDIIFAGPPEEMEKLLAVNWNFIGSSEPGADFISYLGATRLSPNSVKVAVICHQQIF